MLHICTDYNQNIHSVNQEIERREDFLNDNTAAVFPTLNPNDHTIVDKTPHGIFKNLKVRKDDNERVQLDIDGITKSQQLILETFTLHATRIFNEEEDIEPLLMMIQGGPGVGKSWVVGKMMEILDQTGIGYLTVAATGAAASYYFNAETIHTSFALKTFMSAPSNNYENKLENLPLVNLTNRLHKPKTKSYLFIDEISQVSSTMLGKVSQRCKEAFDGEAFATRALKPFAGLSTILIGDFWQMPPVGGKPLYKDLLYLHNLRFEPAKLKSDVQCQKDLESVAKPRYEATVCFKGKP